MRVIDENLVAKLESEIMRLRSALQAFSSGQVKPGYTIPMEMNFPAIQPQNGSMSSQNKSPLAAFAELKEANEEAHISVSHPDMSQLSQLLEISQQLMNGIEDIKNTMDKFFSFEIEEEELKKKSQVSLNILFDRKKESTLIQWK